MGAALGWSVHSGWAVVVGVAMDEPGAPSLLLRRRVSLLAPELPRQPYHAAESLPRDEAAALIDEVARSVHSVTGEVVAEAITSLLELRPGTPVAAVLGGPGTPLPPLERILASHALLHAAEGILYREAVAEAARERGARVELVGPKTVREAAERALGWPPGRASAWLTEVGKTAGPPWQKDHKDAALAALVTMARG